MGLTIEQIINSRFLWKYFGTTGEHFKPNFNRSHIRYICRKFGIREVEYYIVCAGIEDSEKCSVLTKEGL